jgi:serine phosphatase RsbU (regulator of sigma subunit)
MSKKVNPWVEHVKKYAKDNNLSYMCAVEQARASYNKPIKIGKRQKLKENEEKYLKELEAKDDSDSRLFRDALLAKMAKRDKQREQRQARKNPQTNFPLSQLQEKMDSLIEKSKTAKGDELVFITDLIYDIRNAIGEKESKAKKKREKK